MNKKIITIGLALYATVCAAGECSLTGDYPIKMPQMGRVKATGGFWAAREATNRIVTAASNIAQCRKSARLDNFVNAGKCLRGEKHEPFKGIFFNDSDVYKAVEGIMYTLAMHPDAELEAEMERLIADFASAQEYDGYLFTARTLGNRNARVGPHRWFCDDAHELYCMGHMIEAAVAHYRTTGRDTFLKVACNAADMMCRTFGYGEGQIKFLPGHEEIEIALAKLYTATGKRKYLDLSLFFLSMRGLPPAERIGVKKRGFPNDPAYYQDHIPVRDQKEAVGHAVRAGYLYAAMCDAGVYAKDEALLKAVDSIWNDIVSCKMHLSGGIGVGMGKEAFGPAYKLDNERCYLETCAAIANALFNERMFRRTGESKYLDVVERVAYNGFLASTSLAGDHFFYPNPLASRGGYGRVKWFGCACCPPNIVRFIPQFINWTYSVDAAKNVYYWNFFATSEADLGDVKFSQKTGYPWNGTCELKVAPAKNGSAFTLKVRIPGWARGIPAPGALYSQTVPSRLSDVKCTVNGKSVAVAPGADGFIAIAREWNRGDTVRLDLPMDIKRIKADDRVEADRGRFAVERGPILYCAEGADNGGKAVNSILPPDAELNAEPIHVCGVPMTAVKGGGLVLVPYFAWNNRGNGEMQTWFAKDREAMCGNDAGIIAAASHCFYLDDVGALFDGKLPKASDDSSIPRFTFWPRRGTSEWIEFEFPAKRKLGSIEVYWFDDHHSGKGECALPEQWTVQTRVFPGLPWEDVKGAKYTTVLDGYSKAVFPDAVEAETFRIRVRSQKNRSAGILEVRLPDLAR